LSLLAPKLQSLSTITIAGPKLHAFTSDQIRISPSPWRSNIRRPLHIPSKNPSLPVFIPLVQMPPPLPYIHLPHPPHHTSTRRAVRGENKPLRPRCNPPLLPNLESHRPLRSQPRARHAIIRRRFIRQLHPTHALNPIRHRARGHKRRCIEGQTSRSLQGAHRDGVATMEVAQILVFMYVRDLLGLESDDVNGDGPGNGLAVEWAGVQAAVAGR
ncbi:MAG: hypothetical protein Q9183_004251, partial [Haloplaca sp. 2 TL-2023]